MSLRTAPPPSQVGNREWVVPAIIGVAVLMQTMSATVVMNALPAIASSLQVEPLRLNLLITIYLLSVAISLPLTGWLADRLGARRVFIVAIAFYAMSSAAGGLSQTFTQLIAARFVQGAASSALFPVGRLILLRTLPKADFVAALAVVSMASLVGPLLGPVLGGALVSYANWRWIFFINLPIAACGIALAWQFVPDVKGQGSGPIDLVGAATAGVGLASLILGFERLGSEAAGALTRGAPFAAGIAALIFYSRHAARTPHAILNLKVFRNVAFKAAVVGGGMFRLAVAASPFVLVMLFQLNFRMSAFVAGFAMSVTGAGALLMKTVAPSILRRFGFRTVLVANTVLAAICFMAPAAFTQAWPLWAMMAVLTGAGFFQSLQMTCLNSLAYSGVSSANMSSATTTAAMVQMVAQAIGVGLAAALLDLLRKSYGGALQAPHLSSLFVAIGLVSATSLFWFVRLPQDVGSEMSGRTSPPDG